MKRFWILIPLLFLTLNPSPLLTLSRHLRRTASAVCSFGRTSLVPSKRAGANPAIFTATAETQTISVITSTPLEDGTIYHIVQFNEALWSIALAYNTTVEQLKLLNSLSTNDIYEGQKLLIQKPEIKTATREATVKATFGIPTSTATRPVTPTVMSTATSLPTPPTSRQSGGRMLGAIVFIALLAAGVGSWLSRQSKS
jgi:LysM repeat protein